jgi:hypothetical protein
MLAFFTGATTMPNRAAELFDTFHESIGLPLRVLAGIAMLVGILPAQERVNAASVPSQSKIQAQTACETEMLREMGAREVLKNNRERRLLGHPSAMKFPRISRK